MQFALPAFVCRGNGDESRCIRFGSQQRARGREHMGLCVSLYIVHSAHMLRLPAA